MPWTRALVVTCVAAGLALGGAAGCGAHAITSASSSRADVGVNSPPATSASTPSVSPAPGARSSSAPSVTGSAAAVVKSKPVRPVTPTLSPLDPASSIIATAHHGIAVYSAPNGPYLRHFSAVTYLDSVRTFLVAGRQGTDWLQVQLPVRPNGTRGWIRATSVTTATSPMAIDVDRRAHVLTLLRAGVPVRSFPVAVGASATPTPAGVFFISDRLPTLAPYGPYGPYALGLSGHSDVLLTFDGGDGVLGIHGTNADWSVGHAVSHGCIRMHNRDISWLYPRIPLGAAVVVH